MAFLAAGEGQFGGAGGGPLSLPLTANPYRPVVLKKYLSYLRDHGDLHLGKMAIRDSKINCNLSFFYQIRLYQCFDLNNGMGAISSRFKNSCLHLSHPES